MNNSKKRFKILTEEVVHQGFIQCKRLSLRHSLFNGGWSRVLERELFQRRDCVAVLPYDPVTDQVVLIEQFRVGAVKNKSEPWLTEIVAGVIEEGEKPVDVAIRECREEAGCRILDLLRVQEFYTSPGASSEKLTLFCGRTESRGIGGVHGLRSEDEDILVKAVDFAEAMTKMDAGEIDSAIPIVALQWLALNRERLRQNWPKVSPVQQDGFRRESG